MPFQIPVLAGIEIQGPLKYKEGTLNHSFALSSDHTHGSQWDRMSSFSLVRRARSLDNGPRRHSVKTDLKHNNENDPVGDCHVGEHPLDRTAHAE